MIKTSIESQLEHRLWIQGSVVLPLKLRFFRRNLFKLNADYLIYSSQVSNIGYCDLFGIWVLPFGIYASVF